MLKCKEVTGLVATGSLENIGWMKKLEIRMHLMMCVHCRRYLSQIRAIGHGAQTLVRGQEADPEQLQRMEQEVLHEICGHDHGHHSPPSDGCDQNDKDNPGSDGS